MATEIASYMTLIEYGNRHKAKELLKIASSMKANPLISDAIWKEANDNTSHTFDKAVSYPSLSVRKLNKGVVPDNAQTQPETVPVCSFEGHMNLDVKYEELEGSNFPQFRADEEQLHWEGASRTFMSQFIYGTGIEGNVEGLFTRYNAPASQDNVYDEGSTTDSVCSSALMVKWGPDGVFLVYPKGSKKHGIIREPMGKQLVTVNTTTGEQQWVWNTVFGITFGLCVVKDVAVQRLGSIDSTDTVDPDNLTAMAVNMYEEYGSYDNVVLYVNATVFGQLWAANNAKPGILSQSAKKDPWGNPVWAFNGIPIKLMGGLLNTEDDI